MRGIPKWATALSVWVSERCGGPKGWSICAVVYLKRLEDQRWKPAVTLIDKLFWWDAQHCRKAYLMRVK